MPSGRNLFIPIFLTLTPWGAAETFQPFEALRNAAPKVFLDCDYCDESYIRTEIPFVNYVRDRKEADVHLLMTRQATGSGGKEHTVAMIGQMRFEGMDETLQFASKPDDTDDI